MDPLACYLLILWQARRYDDAVRRRCFPCSHIWFDLTVRNFQFYMEQLCLTNESLTQ